MPHKKAASRRLRGVSKFIDGISPKRSRVLTPALLVALPVRKLQVDVLVLVNTNLVLSCIVELCLLLRLLCLVLLKFIYLFKQLLSPPNRRSSTWRSPPQFSSTFRRRSLQATEDRGLPLDQLVVALRCSDSSLKLQLPVASDLKTELKAN